MCSQALFRSVVPLAFDIRALIGMNCMLLHIVRPVGCASQCWRPAGDPADAPGRQGRRRLELFGEDHNIRPGWVTVGRDLSGSNFSPQARAAHARAGQGLR